MAQPQPQEPVLVEPVVNREKLRELLALQAEYSTLDFKSTYDLSKTADSVELAKHVGAMSGVPQLVGIRAPLPVESCQVTALRESQRRENL
jgi:hypothetical protein